MNEPIQITEPHPRRRQEPFSIFSYGFRPFFLAAGSYAVIALLPWVFYLGGWFETDISLQLWHAHEMIFGFIAAGATGFLLTAIPNWVGAPAMIGLRLKCLFAVWLAGRVAFWLFLFFDHPIFGYLLFVDVLLPIMHGFHITRVLVGRGNRRNYVFIAIMAMFVIANLLYILDFNGITNGTAQIASILIINVVMIMVTVIGGRVTPNFTRSYLRQQGVEVIIRSFPVVEKLVVGLLVLNVALDLIMPHHAVSYSVALLAGAAHLVRFSQWQSFRTLHNPALWVLHLGYAWLVIALLLKGAEGWLSLPYHLYLHAFTVGAVGSYMLGIMSRAALGHTGRALSVSKPITTAYLMILLAAIIRVSTPFAPEYFTQGMVSAGSLWMAAFALYVWVYAPILTSPRVDGKPG